MAESEMSMNEIMSSIRGILSQEVDADALPSDFNPTPKTDDVLVLTAAMRCPSEDLQQRMERVLAKMAKQSEIEKNQTVTTQLQPLLKEWIVNVRPDLSHDQVQQELDKVFANS